MKITRNIMIVSHDAGSFSESGKKGLLRLILHGGSLREDRRYVKLSYCS